MDFNHDSLRNVEQSDLESSGDEREPLILPGSDSDSEDTGGQSYLAPGFNPGDIEETSVMLYIYPPGIIY